jgi:hypothetical protein
MGKLQIPTLKNPRNDQAPRFKQRNASKFIGLGTWILKLGISFEFECWNLEFFLHNHFPASLGSNAAICSRSAAASESTSNIARCGAMSRPFLAM